MYVYQLGDIQMINYSAQFLKEKKSLRLVLKLSGVSVTSKYYSDCMINLARKFVVFQPVYTYSAIGLPAHFLLKNS